MSRSGTPSQRLRERVRKVPPPELIAYFRERGLEYAVEQVEIVADGAVVDAAAAAADVVDLSDGTTAFTALNVGGTDVKPFLDLTDGAKITDSAALDDGLVPTVKVADDAITSEGSAFTAASLDVTGTSEITVQTVAFTSTGKSLEIRANFFMTVWHPTAGDVNATVRMYRGATNIYEQAFPAINGDLLQGWMTPTVIEEPAAGAYTYTVTVQVDVSNTAVATAVSRLLSVREFKR